ncbi:putative holin [Marinobacterium stanieri]|uniref:Putative 2/3 transmembrane domain holin n=1 Tax=Marinobacterium stanieri TaxID=49186 RepID=A0A1N6RP40_9GAMM|nr:putative holin [Marinobacterium stanieri]SIQ30569.1 Putative 2/3 transmembrane domain holin [Marinobacterium stanieri]
MLQNFLSKLPIPRLVVWLIVSVALLAGIALVSPQQLPVVLYKIALVTIAAVLAYWLDRTLFPYARPHELFDQATRRQEGYTQHDCERGSTIRWSANIATLRRALIVLACVLGLTLGL